MDMDWDQWARGYVAHANTDRWPKGTPGGKGGEFKGDHTPGIPAASAKKRRTEDEVDLWEADQVFASLDFLASKNRDHSKGAADYYHKTADEKIDYFNDVISPIWEDHGYPYSGGGEPAFLEFTDEITYLWKNGKRPPAGWKLGDDAPDWLK